MPTNQDNEKRTTESKPQPLPPTPPVELPDLPDKIPEFPGDDAAGKPG